jgi:class 3 adenylate cyclase
MDTPQVRFSLRWKIAIPFMVLALALGLGVIALVQQLLSGDIAERLARQLASSGQQAVDAVVLLESDLLKVERLVANSEGVPQGVVAADAEAVRAVVLPLAVNANSDLVAVVNSTGTSMLTVRRPPGSAPGQYESLRGETYYGDWPLTQQALAGGEAGQPEKNASVELVLVGDDLLPVLVIAGPLRDAAGRTVGAVLVGEYLADVVEQLASSSQSGITIYDQANGQLLDTSLAPQDPASLALSVSDLQTALSSEGERTPLRVVSVNGLPYQEALTALAAGSEGQSLGVVGVSLPEVPVIASAAGSLQQVMLFAAFGVGLTVLLGLLIINYTTRPLVRVAEASARMSRGDLDVALSETGGDEVALLAHSFNTMAYTLRTTGVLPAVAIPEAEKTVPLVAERAAQTSVLRARATVLAAEVDGYPVEAPHVAPETSMKDLSELYENFAKIIAEHKGIVERFSGRELLATFGVQPLRLPTPVAALQAVHAGLAIQETVERWKSLRTPPGCQPARISIGIATGELTSGPVGDIEQSQQIILGSAAEAAGHLKQIAREIPESRVLINEVTYSFLSSGSKRHFLFGRTGQAPVRGRDHRITLYEVLGRNLRLIESRQA